MVTTYTTYEAKARFSEIMRKIRAGNSVIVTYRGEEMAEIRPIARKGDVEAALERLEGLGVLGPSPPRAGGLETIRRVPGGLERFLESRD